MPTSIQIVRGHADNKMLRGDVSQGLVFTVPGAQGRARKEYAAIGANGRLYSVSLINGVLASSGNRRTNVTVIGKWKFGVTRHARHNQRNTTRSGVRPGEVFTVAGGTKEYAHMGRITKDHNGWLSVPLATPENHAVTENGNSDVTVVGTFRMEVTTTK